MKQTGKRYKKLAAALALGMAFSGIAASASAQSLWSGEYSSYNVFADRKARNVGDTLTVVISESTSLSASRANSNSKSGSTDLSSGVGIFGFLAAASASGSDSFSADGSSTSKNTTSANITVTVVDVQPNGNMTVEGTQSIWQNRDEHKITFRGVCRQDDVSVNNTIVSTKIADATVKFDGKGPLNAKQRQGILTQVFNFLF